MSNTVDDTLVLYYVRQRLRLETRLKLRRRRDEWEVCLDDTQTTSMLAGPVTTNKDENWWWPDYIFLIVKMRLSAIWKCMHQYFYLSSFKAVSPTLNGEEQPGGTQKPKSKHCHQTSEK